MRDCPDKTAWVSLSNAAKVDGADMLPGIRPSFSEASLDLMSRLGKTLMKPSFDNRTVPSDKRPASVLVPAGALACRRSGVRACSET